MELPHLGIHCHEKTCNKLDFLPVKCDACKNVFCNDHFQYFKHSCNNAYQQDVQVPVCPLCNAPVPSKRGEQPDIAVSEHIDRDCQADPAIAKRKVYTNKCSMKGCKMKELIRITCNDCKRSFCLQHRYREDHKCTGQEVIKPAQAAGAAAIARAQKSKYSKFQFFTSQSTSKSENRQISPLPEVSITSAQAGMSEDEALAFALQKSLNEVTVRDQEQEDRLLAQALAECEQDLPSQRVVPPGAIPPQNRPQLKNCCVS